VVGSLSAVARADFSLRAEYGDAVNFHWDDDCSSVCNAMNLYSYSKTYHVNHSTDLTEAVIQYINVCLGESPGALLSVLQQAKSWPCTTSSSHQQLPSTDDPQPSLRSLKSLVMRPSIETESWLSQGPLVKWVRREA